MDIRGLDKAEVLAALYNRSKQQGMGLFMGDKGHMSKEEAGKYLAAKDPMNPRIYFDYLNGVVLKVDLSEGEEESFDPRLFDRDNGEGAAAEALQPLFNKLNGVADVSSGDQQV